MTIETKIAKSVNEAVEMVKAFYAPHSMTFTYDTENFGDNYDRKYNKIYRFFDGTDENNKAWLGIIEIFEDNELKTVRVYNDFQDSAVDIVIENFIRDVAAPQKNSAIKEEVGDSKVTINTQDAAVEAEISKAAANHIKEQYEGLKEQIKEMTRNYPELTAENVEALFVAGRLGYPHEQTVKMIDGFLEDYKARVALKASKAYEKAMLETVITNDALEVAIEAENELAKEQTGTCESAKKYRIESICAFSGGPAIKIEYTDKRDSAMNFSAWASLFLPHYGIVINNETGAIEYEFGAVNRDRIKETLEEYFNSLPVNAADEAQEKVAVTDVATPKKITAKFEEGKTYFANGATGAITVTVIKRTAKMIQVKSDDEIYVCNNRYKVNENNHGEFIKLGFHSGAKKIYAANEYTAEAKKIDEQNKKILSEFVAKMQESYDEVWREEIISTPLTSSEALNVAVEAEIDLANKSVDTETKDDALAESDGEEKFNEPTTSPRSADDEQDELPKFEVGRSYYTIDFGTFREGTLKFKVIRRTACYIWTDVFERIKIKHGYNGEYFEAFDFKSRLGVEVYAKFPVEDEPSDDKRNIDKIESHKVLAKLEKLKEAVEKRNEAIADLTATISLTYDHIDYLKSTIPEITDEERLKEIRSFIERQKFCGLRMTNRRRILLKHLDCLRKKLMEIQKVAHCDSLARAMKFALENVQKFCRDKNLTAAQNEFKLYNICSNAMHELQAVFNAVPS